MEGYFKQLGKADGLSEDLAQIVFMRIWQKRKTFREDSTFQAFLNSFVKKVLQEHKRKKKKESDLIHNSPISGQKSRYSDPQAICIFKELLKNIELNKSKLSNKQRQAVELSLEGDFMPKKAAKKACCSNNTYRYQLFAGRHKLKKLMKIAEKL